MSERIEYGKRRNEAIESKESFLSLISDGMSQGHCELPYLQNLTTFNKKLTQHLQGILLHGRGMIVYRTFHNVKLGANAQIHCFLSTLEYIEKNEGNSAYFKC